MKESFNPEDTRVFIISPMADARVERSALLDWVHSHRDLISLTCMIVGGVMIITDPGMFSEGIDLPFTWGDRGAWGNLMVIDNYLNWSSSGWNGLGLVTFGSISSWLTTLLIR